MTTWEYAVIHRGEAGDHHLVNLASSTQEAVTGPHPWPRIHALGLAGWELISVVALPETAALEYWFKRPRP